MPTRVSGKVKFYKPRPSNFGFIAGDDGVDYFFSIQDLKNSGLYDDNTENDLRGIGRGDRVLFTPYEGRKGPAAGAIVLTSHGS